MSHTPSGRNPPSEQELRVLQIVWGRGTANVREVCDNMGSDCPAYNTIQTVMNRMVKKGLLCRERVARDYRYAAAGTESQMKAGFFRWLIDRVFGGSVSLLVQNLLHTGQIREEELKLLTQQLQQQRKAPAAASEKGPAK